MSKRVEVGVVISLLPRKDLAAPHKAAWLQTRSNVPSASHDEITPTSLHPAKRPATGPLRRHRISHLVSCWHISSVAGFGMAARARKRTRDLFHCGCRA